MLKKRILSAALAILLVFSFQSGLALRADADAGSDGTCQSFDLPNEAPARLEFLTDPMFKEGAVNSSYYAQEHLYCDYNAVFYLNFTSDPIEAGAKGTLLNQYGAQISTVDLQFVTAVSDRIMLVTDRASAKLSVYRDGSPMTGYIYSDYKISGDCLVMIKDSGRDFYDLSGNRRTPGKLPAGYEARLVTSAGTVVARTKNTAISSPNEHYNFGVFDRNGKELLHYWMTGLDENDPLWLSADWCLTNGSLLWDLNGVQYGSAQCPFIINDQYVICGNGNVGFTVYNRQHEVIGTFEADRVENVCGESIVIYKDDRYGMVNLNGETIAAPQFTSYYSYFEESYLINSPAVNRIIFRKPGNTYCLYDDKGTELAVFPENWSLQYYLDCIVLTSADKTTTRVLDMNGELQKEYTNKEQFKVCNGVHCLSDASSSAYYVVDLQGNRLSDLVFSRINELNTKFSVYGLVNVMRGGIWYVVNAAGEVQNPAGMDRPVRMPRSESARSIDPKKQLGVYYVSAKSGICRYVPPVLPCEKEQDGKHDWTLDRVIQEATCTQTGSAVYCCAACGAIITADTPTDPDNHDWTFTEVVSQPAEGETHGVGLYTCARCGETKEDRLCAGEIFTDMPAEGNWAHDPIDWAYFSGITDGVDDHLFGPEQTCTRAQIVTFLWRAAGEPSVDGAENPFEDVKETDWFYAPVLWAVSEGITDGMTDTTFAPKQNCTRNQVVTFLWRANGKAVPGELDNPFTDVPEGSWFYEPVLWALEHGVTDGVSDTLFGAKQNCTRAQVVTFLYRCKDLTPATPAPEPTPEP